LNFDLPLLDVMESPFFEEEMMRRILNIDKTDISVNRSKRIVGSKPEDSFHDPHLPLPCLSSAKSLHSCTGRRVCACALAATIERKSRGKREALL
jgi:hypothetical protein